MKYRVSIFATIMVGLFCSPLVALSDETEEDFVVVEDSVSNTVFKDELHTNIPEDSSLIEDPEVNEEPLLYASSDSYSGDCGISAFWEYDSDTKSLMITGSGSMDDYTSQYKAPWADVASDATTLSIAEGITTLGSYNFYNLRKLVTYNIPVSVSEIGAYAFCNCSLITDCTIPSNVKKIGDGAFSGCSQISSVTIPASVNTFGKDIFSKSGVTNAVFDEGVTAVPEGLFSECIQLSSVEFSSTIQSIGDCAFNKCSSLSSVAFSDGIKSIGAYAFQDCDTLSIVSIPTTVTTIKENAFYNCNKLRSVTINGKITKMGAFAFYQCPLLSNLTLSEGCTVIGYRAFEYCTNLKNVVLPSTMKEIGDYAFQYSGLLSITLPDGLVKIGDSAFSRTPLTSIVIPSSVTEYGEDLFAVCKDLKSVTLPNTMKTIPFGMFSGECGIEEIVIPDGVETICEDAFNCADQLKTITIPRSVTEIQANAFPVGATTVYYKGCSVADWLKIYFPYGDDDEIDLDTIHYIHSLEKVDEKASTCSERGNPEYYRCQKCSKCFLDSLAENAVSLSSILYPLSAHLWDNPTYEWADDYSSCTAIRVCKNNSSHSEEETVTATGTIVTAASCLASGSKLWTSNSFKNDAFEAQSISEILPANGHKAGAAVKENEVPPTCSSGGSYEEVYYCSACEIEISRTTKSVEKLPHKWNSGRITKAATTTTNGVKIYTCNVCGETKTESIAKLAPTEKITITKKPTIQKPIAAKGKITVKWKHFKHTSKKTKPIWKKIKKVQVQCATDSGFKNIVKDVKVGRGKTKYAIKGLQKKTTYYVRVRYYDGTGYSDWSKVKKVKTK